ncbi:MAG: hypothetical protein NC489_36295 [Ruminococcus flavefaciens]|nr:hypothetical protein [Ruminococcus flavefaciens]
MAISKSREKVRDGYLGDLPPEIQKKVMEIHKLVVKTIRDFLDEDSYQDLKNSSWAMSCIDDFCVMPKDKDQVGSIRVYKSGKTYRCMIQLTGHFQNHLYGWIEELLHDFIKNVFMEVKIKVRKKYDMTMTNEGSAANPYEGFDLFPNPKVVRAICDKLDDRKTRTITENGIFLDEDENDFLERSALHYGDHYSAKKLPDGLIRLVRETNILVYDTFKELSKDPKYSALTSRQKDFERVLKMLDGTGHKSEIGFTSITDADEDIKVTIVVTPEPRSALTSWSSGGDSAGDAQNALNQLMKDTEKKISAKFHKENPTKYLELVGDEDKEFFAILAYADYAHKLKDHLDHPKSVPFTEAKGEEYNAEMNEEEAKKTLRTLSQSIINDNGKKVTQYTANIYANIITKNLLPKWAPGYQRFHITLDDYQSFHYFHFKVPKMTKDFIERFINGREQFAGLLHREPVINVKMSPCLFANMENPDDAYNFFKAAIQYYDKTLERYANKLMAEVMKLDTPTKHLIATTKLEGLVTIPMSILFNFEDVKMSDRNTFKVSSEDIKTIQKFVRDISSHYAAPEKEQSAIISNLKDVVKSLQEYVDFSLNENIGNIREFPEAVQDYYNKKYDPVMESVQYKMHMEQVDHLAMRNESRGQVRYLQEKFGVKKLKKIPNDLIAYISIETEAIKDANDKMMIASYCLGKIEIVEWYIELLEVGSKKYIVPHTKPYLENVRTQLLACYKKIMATPIPKTQERPLIDIQYPKGYEG